MTIHKLLLVILLSTCIAPVVYGQAQTKQFNNQYRPTYNQSVTAKQLMVMQSIAQPVVLDVRLEEDFQQNPVLIPGAQRLNPEQLSAWISANSKQETVVVYCAGGKWVGQKAAFLLNQAGFTVHNLQGGLNAWQAATQNATP